MQPDQWQRAVQPLLVLASLLYLAAYSAQVLIVDQPGWLVLLLALVVTVTWLAFIVDYLVRLAIAPKRGSWFVHHLPELLMVVLPFLRPLRLLQLLTLVRVLNRSGAASARGRTVVYVVGAAVFVVYVGALTEYALERDAPGASIVSFGDALWWAAATVTTVGYGDVVPVTIPGRIVAVVVMLVGIAVLGSVTAALTSWLAQQTTSRPAEDPGLKQELREIRGHLAELAPVGRKRQGEAPTQG